MRRATLLAALGLSLFLASGCIAFKTPVTPPPGLLLTFKTPVAPPPGLLFTFYKAPLTTEYHPTPICDKRGEASTFCIRDIVFTKLMTIGWQRADIDTAARNGGLQTVKYAEYEALIVLGLFGKFKVIAYGE